VIDIDFFDTSLKMNLVELSRCGSTLPIPQVTFNLTFDKNKLYQKLFNAFASCNVSNGVWSHFVIGYNFTFLASKLLNLKYVILMNKIIDHQYKDNGNSTQTFVIFVIHFVILENLSLYCVTTNQICKECIINYRTILLLRPSHLQF
jgi:hypothetical protein